jgi:CRISPR-associated Csx2 family protein
MSNALMAFLGTTDYRACNYSMNGCNPVKDVRFIQEALVSLLCKDWTENDRIVIFLTEKAKDTNWVDNGQKQGLENRLKSLGLKVNLVPIFVPEGRTETEIWTIFEEVFNQINNDDDVIFDITHSFRSLPMLAIVILNYAKVLKNIKINGVYYGAYEALDAVGNASIFNLTPLVQLFEWTNATSNFIKYGDAEDISKLSLEKIDPILKEKRGADQSAQDLKKLSKQLVMFTKYIQTCRGLNIIEGYEIKILKEAVRNNKDSFITPMNPLFDKISEKIENFRLNDIKNGYAAVEWCINHNLVQQGYTILLETIISQWVVKCFGKDEITNIDKRDLVSDAVYTKYSENYIKFTDSEKVDIQNLKNYMSEDFVRLYDTISQTRNDINHAGMRKNPQKPDDLINNLKEYYNKFKAGENDV